MFCILFFLFRPLFQDQKIKGLLDNIKINFAKHPFGQSYTNFFMNKNKINNKTKLNKI